MKPCWLILLFELFPSLLAQTVVSSKLSETVCEQANNTVGTCECEGQLFVSEECSKGFYCMSGTSEEGYTFEGCQKQCAEDEVLIVDPRPLDGPEWYCWKNSLPETKRPMICPGKMNTECGCTTSQEACPIGECECEGQLRVSQDCKTARYCTADSYDLIECEKENEIVIVNMWTNTWHCGEDDGRCPGAFHVGCQPDTTITQSPEEPTDLPTQEPTTPISESRCTYANNTIGSCECGEQLFIGEGCTKGFYCMSAEEFPNPDDAKLYEGCEIKCNEDEILLADPRQGTWSCAPTSAHAADPKIVLCPGKFNTECVCTGDADACPIGECECDAQLRVSSDCKYAKFCNSSTPAGFEDITCGDDKIVIVNLLSHTWYCGRDDGRCPGAFHVGCQEDVTEEPTILPTTHPATPSPTTLPTETCHHANNTLGTCDCDKQLFIGEGCSKGFYCMAGTSAEGPYEGCDITCDVGNMLLVDPRNGGDWRCIREGPNYCPGKFNTECACEGGLDECPIGDCECDAQLRVSHDCKTAKYCNETLSSGFETISCDEPGEIVYVDLDRHNWHCAKDDDRCPGAFHVGCQEDQTEAPTQEPTTTTPESQCTLANNTLGECGCGKQLFVGDECKKGFYCMDKDEFPTEEDALHYDGCEIDCADDETLYVDPRLGGSWRCMKRIGPMPMWCPGKFNTECGCNDGPDACPIGECECDGQLRVAHDCKTAKYCNETVAGGFETITCTGDELVYVNLVTHKWNCGEDDGRCPGAFHVGCQDDVTEEPTQKPTTTTTLPESRCTFANNTLGSCTCDEQLFISGDCQKVNFSKKAKFAHSAKTHGLY